MAAPVGFVRRLLRLQRIVRPADARAVALALLVRIALHTAPDLKMPRYRRQLPAPVQGLVDDIGGLLIQQSLEIAAYHLSCIYAVLVDPEERRDLAMYFTPPDLANHIVSALCKETRTFAALRFMDPACGGAAFLLPVVIRLRNLMREQGRSATEIIRCVNVQVIGIERDPLLAELARQSIRMALAEELIASKAKLKQIIRVGNTLHLQAQKRLPRANVVICNPPYRKIHASELPWYRQRFPEVIAGQPNLYSMFMRVATDLVAPGGLIALLTPTSYFSGPTYEPIRALYVRHSSIARIDLIHERDNLFLGVEHDVAALIAHARITPPARQTPEIYAWEGIDDGTALGPVALPIDGRPWHLPRDAATALALTKSQQTRWTLAEYGYKVRIGVYVWNRDKRRVRKSQPKGRDRKHAVPVVWATQIGQDGKFRFISKSQKEQRARFILLRPGERAGVVSQDSVVLQRTSSRAQRRRLVAAALPAGFAKKHGGFVGENHVVILEPTSRKPLVSRKQLVRLLNSDFIRDLYSTTSGTTAVTASGLRALPLPDPVRLKDLVRRRHAFEHAVRRAFANSMESVSTRVVHAKAPTF